VGASVDPLDLAPGCLLLAISSDSENEIAKAALAAFGSGQQVSIVIKADPLWNDIAYAVGGGEKLLTNSQVVAPEFSAGSRESRMPRTAIGVRPDGSYVFYTVDGRQKGYSGGLTLSEVAERLRELGCTEAVNLDGGGSTTISAVYPGLAGLKTINRPSDGSLRTCANYILLINRGIDNGSAQHLHLYPFDSLVLAGASLDFSLSATNEHYLPAVMPNALTEYYVDKQTWGTVNESGRFTAGHQVGSGYVYAQNNGITGRARITVVDRVDSVTMLYASSGKAVGKQITLYGGGSVALSMRGIYRHMEVIADAASFNWSLSENIGTIDDQGILRVYQDAPDSEGILTASLGTLSISVPVIISNTAELKEDFETFAEQEDEDGTWQLTQNTDKTLVRLGNASARLDYDFNTAFAGRISVPFELDLNDGPSHLNFWLYGDDSQNQLQPIIWQGDELRELPLIRLDFTGWQNVSLSLPEGVTALASLDLLHLGNTVGSLYLDHIMSAHGRYIDNDPPEIEATIEEGVLLAKVTDTMDKKLLAANIRLFYDGLPLQSSYDQGTGKLSATLPSDDGISHRLTITARDKNGNIARHSLDIAANEEQPQPFIDMKGHWASGYTAYLYQQGVVNGIAGAKGFSYAPDTNMNRAQFAVIMCNWLGVDTDLYAQTELPFDDIAAIGEWAYPAIQAMYSLGITKGSALNGRLNYNPASPISRAEAMTMIGRTMEKGYAEAALNFVDSAAVPEWAAPYVRVLVQQQVVSGMEGNRLAPSAYVSRAQVAKMLYSLI
ncbi:MAG: phosphodiester glycosidase family protein, partial [Clostridiales bacterium]|nr:phosphodiester glycosidase family protein [Clostridiales bacterium]